MALVPVCNLLKLADPLKAWPWPCPAPSQQALDALWSTPPEAEPVPPEGPASRHLGRIRFLAEQGWTQAIEIDVGVPMLGYPVPDWPVLDGNHRLAAAALRNDMNIHVDVAGQVDHAAELLGVSEDVICDGRVQAEN